MKAAKPPDTLLPRPAMERAFAARDSSYDGLFFVAVRTTGIFCRPSCPSCPKPENIEFFASAADCLAAGYRPCHRCRPTANGAPPPAWVQQILARLEANPGQRLKAQDLRSLGVTPERVRRWFKERFGMSFATWCRRGRLAGALAQIQKGAPLDEAIFASGYESHSGFREAFNRVFGAAPGRARGGTATLVACVIESPLGPLLAGVQEDSLCWLDFMDQRSLEMHLAAMQRRCQRAVIPGSHPLLTRLHQELDDYFKQQRNDFTVPIRLQGTPFQQKVWTELLKIPYGQTISYEELALRIGQPSARRAVALANGMNHICILVPCHRVIGKNGSLTGYGGGLWRKRLLLQLESPAAR